MRNFCNNPTDRLYCGMTARARMKSDPFKPICARPICEFPTGNFFFFFSWFQWPAENKCYYIIQRKATMSILHSNSWWNNEKGNEKFQTILRIRKLHMANKQPNILETFSRSQGREKYKECLYIRCERRPRAGGALWPAVYWRNVTCLVGGGQSTVQHIGYHPY